MKLCRLCTCYYSHIFWWQLGYCTMHCNNQPLLSSAYFCDLMTKATADSWLFYCTGYLFDWYTVVWNIIYYMAFDILWWVMLYYEYICHNCWKRRHISPFISYCKVVNGQLFLSHQWKSSMSFTRRISMILTINLITNSNLQ